MVPSLASRGTILVKITRRLPKGIMGTSGYRNMLRVQSSVQHAACECAETYDVSTDLYFFTPTECEPQESQQRKSNENILCFHTFEVFSSPPDANLKKPQSAKLAETYYVSTDFILLHTSRMRTARKPTAKK